LCHGRDRSREQCSLDPGTVVPVVVYIVVYTGEGALFNGICSLLRALELNLCILELDPGECGNSLKFLIVKNVFLRVLSGRTPLYPDNKWIVNGVK